MMVQHLIKELQNIPQNDKVVYFDIKLVTQSDPESELRTWVWKDNGP